jgi:calcineurin-like phosphoesterase family protein
MSIFFTSDNHFGHEKIIKYCNRPFGSVREMDEIMIERWNAIVNPGDLVYHLGDFALTSVDYAESILKRLNGQIHLCRGSHEKTALVPRCRKYFISIHTYKTAKRAGAEIFLAHYLHKIWPKSHYGTWHLFGHSHGGMDIYAAGEGKLLDVGVDSHDFRPWTLEEVQAVMETRPLNRNDLKRRFDNPPTNGVAMDLPKYF